MSQENSSKKKMDVHKVVLPTKRVAYLRDLKISDSRTAAKMVGKKASNTLEMQVAIQEELLKLLLIQIDDKRLDHADKNDLDSILKFNEYKCLMKVMEKLAGEDESGEEVEMEFTSI